MTAGSDVFPQPRELVDVIGPWPGSVVITRGGYAVEWPQAWISVEYAHPAAIAAHTRCMIWLYHGGNGTSYQLLRQWAACDGVTAGAVALPINVEHQWNAAKLGRLGVVQTTYPIAAIPSPIVTAHIRRTLTDLSDRPVPPSADVIHAVQRYADAPERAAQEVLLWAG